MKEGFLVKLSEVIFDHYMTKYGKFNTYSMKQPDLYYFETIKMTS